MSGSGDSEAQSPQSENREYEPDDYASSRSATALLRRRPSFTVPVLVLLVVLVAVALLVAIGINRLGPDNLPKLSPQNETEPPPKQPDRLVPEQPVEPTEPFKSLVLDAAQSYLAFGSPPVATVGSKAKPNPSQ